MTVEQVFGVVFLAMSAVSVVAYIGHFTGTKLPVWFWKLNPMQERCGRIPGTILHALSYLVLPILVGIRLLWGGGL